MSQDLDRLADIVASRIRAQMAGTPDGPTGAPLQSCVGDDCKGLRALAQNGAVRLGPPAEVANQVATDLAGFIDHTLLKPETTREELLDVCDQARRHNFASVCVNSSNVAFCHDKLAGTKVMVCAVVGFPLGAMSPASKAFETREAVRNGASEIDMVINIGALRDGDYALVLDDITKVVTAARPAKVKVILETSKLTDEQKVAGSTLSKLAGAHFVKTSTGFGGGGATAEDVALMRRVVGAEMGVKASGGVRSEEDVRRMLAAGANRIGASASVEIVTGKTGDSAY